MEELLVWVFIMDMIIVMQIKLTKDIFNKNNRAIFNLIASDMPLNFGFVNMSQHK